MPLSLEQIANISEKIKAEKKLEKRNNIKQKEAAKARQEAVKARQEGDVDKRKKLQSNRKELAKTAFDLWWKDGLDVPEVSKAIRRGEVATQRFIQGYLSQRIQRRLLNNIELGVLKSHKFCFYPYHAKRCHHDTVERDNAIFDDWKRGEDVYDIAEKYGIQASRTWDILRRFQDAGYVGYRVKSREGWQPVIDEYNQGFAVPYLADKYNINLGTVNSALSKHLKPNVLPRHTRMANRDKNIIKMSKNKTPVDDICRAFRIRPSYVLKIQHQMERNQGESQS